MFDISTWLVNVDPLEDKHFGKSDGVFLINNYFQTKKMKLYISRMITCDVKELENSAARKAKEAQAAVNNKILFNNLWVFDIFVLLTVIIMQYLYDSV